MFTKAVAVGSMVGALMFIADCSAARADDETAVRGNNPAVRCAAATEAASKSWKVSPAAELACRQAVGWAHFVQDELGAALANRGVLHLISGDHQAAIADFNEALRAGADQALVLNDRGLAQAALHQYDAATADYTAALSKTSNHTERLYFNRAMAEEDAGNLKAAYLDYKKALAAAPNWQKAARELSRFTVAYPAMV